MQEFTKYHGTGNDFILIDNRPQKFDKKQNYIAGLCNRHIGIGADGLILLENPDHAENNFKMVYYNADGNIGSMCGNGGRCVVAFAHTLGIITETAQFEAVDGLHHARLQHSEICLKLGDVDNYKNYGKNYVLNTGSPHFIQFVPHLNRIDVEKEGKKIRYGPEFQKEGINVNFVELGKETHRLRTYERGVEAETLSCGTGAVAAAIAITLRLQKESHPLCLQTRGGELKIEFKVNQNSFSDIWLTGPTKKVFTGILQ